MTAIVRGLNATIKSTNCEASIAELAGIIVGYQKSLTNNPNQIKGISITDTSDDYLTRIAFNLNYTDAVDASGNVTITITNYLSGVSYVAGGTNATYKSTNPIGAFFEAIRFLQTQELSGVKNPTGLENIDINFDDNLKQVSGSVALKVDFTTDSTGKRVYAISEWYA
jgi:hypothetical protein